MVNFDTLFRVKVNSLLLFGLVMAIFIMFPNLSWFSLIAIIVSLYQFNLLFNSIGYVIPIRYIFGTFMCLQMLLGPMLAYNGLDSFQREQYQMQIPEFAYFSYVIPAVIAFILGLHLNAGKLKGEVINVVDVEKYVERNKNLPYVFIVVGFVASLVSGVFSSNIAFVMYLFGGFKYLGAFMLIISKRRLKIIPLVVVYGSIVASSLVGGMFHDLLTWILFLGCILAIRYKPGVRIKLGLGFVFIFLVFAIQQLKEGYREATWQRGEEAGLETLNNTISEREASNSFFSLNSLGKTNLRFNQGYIITYIMKNVPDRVPHSYGGELYRIIEAAILPRILAPNKLNAGDRELFMKYSGMRIAKKTSMGLSSVGDGYINFGVVGGCIFMFFLGLLFNYVLKSFQKYSRHIPVLLLFTPLVFYYPIRPDCELQTILGHLVKSCFLIFVVVNIWEKHFFLYFHSAEDQVYPNKLVATKN